MGKGKIIMEKDVPMISGDEGIIEIDMKIAKINFDKLK